MKRLQLGFKTEAGKNSNFMLNYAKDNLDEDTIKQAMDKIIASKLFEKDSIQLYAKQSFAKYIERNETPVFQGK